jgi:hypothetical protein
LLQRQPPLSRRQLSLQLCLVWNWRTDSGQCKDMAARSLLRKLQQRGLIQLPPIRHLPWAARPRSPVAASAPVPRPLAASEPIAATLAELSPLKVSVIATASDRRLLAQHLQQHHYLGWNRLVGESIAYWAHDRHGRLLAFCLWGAAAWKVAPRDDWIGWSEAQRAAGLKFVANNHRFLILPWVDVPHLGSHLLGQIQRRIRSDWRAKYQHDLYLLESFVQLQRFSATVYRAANWQCLGQTQGRSRQDRFHQLNLPRKSIWMAVLQPRFRELLYESTGLPA